MAMQLRRAGHDDFFILERGPTFGGTWRDNTYPGAACDIPSMLYCFSFEPKVDWTRKFAPQAEIQQYLLGLAEKYRLAEKARFGVDVTRLVWDDARCLWLIESGSGETFEAEVVVSAFGQLHEPKWPDIPGLASFDGETMHTARYRHEVPVEGRRVAVIGNAASAVQLIPRVAERAARLAVFQRTPTWVGLRNDRAYTRIEHALFRALPFVARLVRWLQWANFDYRFPLLEKKSLAMPFFTWLTRWEMRRRIANDALKQKLVPSYAIACNRFLISDDYLETYGRPNVTLVTESIERVEPGGVRTQDGSLHEADVLVLATGFDTNAFLARIDVRGRGAVSLRDVYREGAFAYLGMTVPSFPNLFQLYGPNTNLGHNSILVMLEAQVGYVLQALERLAAPSTAALDLREDVMKAYDVEIMSRLAELNFSADCHSWYKNESGRITNNWAYDTRTYRARTASFQPSEYEIIASKG